MDPSQAQINHEAYQQKYQRDLERDHLGRVALMHDGELVEIYNDEGDAYAIGCDKFGLGNFSIKTIGDRPVQMGIVAAATT
ncbi:hypothetical protein [Candidatus Poriferisodalis sp.]|uniref:hypothetical protein n=1 Tax=Candidatus Poriferisodalis sp. TaxID=3101277 RepID=UPI003AF6E1BB